MASFAKAVSGLLSAFLCVLVVACGGSDEGSSGSLRFLVFGDPAEIARAVAFLASPQAAYCQGAILDIDGGQTRTL